MTTLPDVVEWAQSGAGFYLPETRRPIVLAPHQAEILRHILTIGPDGRLPYSEVVYSAPKKSGKSTINALVAEYFALFVEPPTEIYCVANDLEQAQGRVYKSLATSVRLNPHLKNRVEVQNSRIIFDNGTTVEAISSDYASAAGSNPSLSCFDELWGYVSERSRRLWDEMSVPPTRRLAMRLTTTYAGYTGESALLEDLYRRGKAGGMVKELANLEDGDGEAAVRANGKLFFYWDHELKEHGGLTISPEEYHTEQRSQLRPLAYLRLHENRFTSNESVFITPDQWQACFSPSCRPLFPGDDRYIILGADASTARDSTALVGVTYDRYDHVADVVFVKVWKPSLNLLVGKAVIDLDQTLKAEILRLAKSHQVSGVVYDPYQLHSIAMELRQSGINMVEMPQTSARVESDQALYDAILARQLRHYNHPDLNEHVRNAVATETPRGFRLAKEKTSMKIDAAVALSMAHSKVETLGIGGAHFW